MAVENGDTITLGCVLEFTSRMVEHHPTDLEVGIITVETPSLESDLWVPGLKPSTKSQIIAGSSTNSFHAPDTESEAEEVEPHIRNVTWRPFVNDVPHPPLADVQQIDPQPVLPPVIEVERFVREKSVSTSANGDVVQPQPQLPPIIDLTGNPWINAGPIQRETIEIASDLQDEYYDEEEDYDEEDYDDDDEDIHSSYEFPYEYDTDDIESVNGEPQAAEQKGFVDPTAVCPSIWWS